MVAGRKVRVFIFMIGLNKKQTTGKRSTNEILEELKKAAKEEGRREQRKGEEIGKVKEMVHFIKVLCKNIINVLN